MEAIIEDDGITINWVSDDGNTRSVYSVGTYIAPNEDAEEYTGKLTDGSSIPCNPCKIKTENPPN